MKKTKKGVGIILVVLGVLAIIGYVSQTSIRLQEGLSVVPTRGIFSEMLMFMMIIGGVLLLINFKKKENENTLLDAEGNCEAQKMPERNLICTTALVFAILSMVISSMHHLLYTIIYLAVAVTSLVLGIVGLKLALSRNEKGEGFAKWAITAGLAALLAFALFCVEVKLEEKYILEKNKEVYSQIAEVAELEEKAKKEVERIKKLSEDIKVNENAEPVYSKGLITETGFESEFLDLRFNTPSGWVIMSEDEKAEKLGSLAAEQIEMLAVELATGSTLQIAVEEPFVSGATLEQYKEAIKTNFERQFGYEFEEEKPSVTLCGKTYDVMAFNLYDYLKMDLYIRKQDDRFIYIVTSYTNGNEAVVETALNALEAY